MRNYHLYGIGAALVDTEIEVSDADLERLTIEKGVMTLVDEQRQAELIELLSDHLVASSRASGGSAANTIIAASYFGSRNFYSCKVADDENGHFYLQDLTNAGVEYHHELHLEPGTTGKCLVMITPDAERTMNTHLGISEQLSVRELHYDAIADSQFAYIEGYLVTSDTGREAAIKLREVAERAQTQTALSLSDPAIVRFFKQGLLKMIGPNGVDLLFCNQEEAMEFTGTTSVSDAANALKSHCRGFAITQGANGALVWDGVGSFDIPAHQVKAIDTNGAGDMFAGAFLYAITHGFNYMQAGQLAVRAAAEVVADFGPRLRPELHKVLRMEVLGQQ